MYASSFAATSHAALAASPGFTADEASGGEATASRAVVTAPVLRSPPITSGVLTEASTLYENLLRHQCERQDALSVLFDFLNTGSTESYRAVLAAADAAVAEAAALPADDDDSTFPRGVRMSQAPLHWQVRSWPEKILMLKDGGAHVTFRLGMNERLFGRGRSLLHRGHERLPPGCMQFVPVDQELSGQAFKAQLTQTQIDPALRSLKPNQALLLVTPGCVTALAGCDTNGHAFALACGMNSDGAGTLPGGGPLRTGAAALRLLTVVREMPWEPMPWAILLPR